MNFPVIMYEGPENGKVLVIREDMTYVRFAVPVEPPFMSTETGPDTYIKTDYVHYQRTKNFHPNGARIYKYVPNESK